MASGPTTAFTPAWDANDLRFRALFESSAVGVGLADMSGTIVEANPALGTMLGTEPAELRQQHVTAFLHPDDGETSWQPLHELLEGTRDHYEMEKRYLRADYTTAWIRISASLLYEPTGSPTYILAVFDDVTEQRLAQERLTYLAARCPLTGLYNRSLFVQSLTTACEDTAGYLALCYLDIDDFRFINDSFGHEIGDELLISVSERLRGIAGPYAATLARLGGDEFGLLLTESPPGAAAKLATHVLNSMREPFILGEREIFVSASIGIVERECSTAEPYQLLRDADATMYWAKGDGKARLAHFNAERSRAEAMGYILAATMPGALERGEFFLEYQPFVQLATNQFSGVEALIRWQHPQYGRLLPESFLALAENTGFIIQLGRWMMDSVCQQIGQWKAAGFWDENNFIVCINAAVRQVHDPLFAENIRNTLKKQGVKAGTLQLEVTEQALAYHTSDAITALRELVDEGVRIAIDDFGTGYSNLSYLAELPVHTLKIAGTFVSKLINDHNRDAQLISGLIELAHLLGLSVTAECVETGAQAEFVRTLGCESGQGWFFGQPGSAKEIEKRFFSLAVRQPLG